MPNTLIIILALLGHIIGDFYAQTNNMASNKKKCLEALLFHGLVYMVCMELVLGFGIRFSDELKLVAILLGFVHLLIDYLKYLLWPAIQRVTAPENLRNVEGRLFIADQIAHLLSIAAILWFWGSPLESRQFVSHEIIIAQAPVPALTVLFGILCVLKPVGMLFERGGILKPYDPKPDDDNNASKTIGYLERLVVFLFLLYKQYGAIAFVLTAKSVARFPETRTKEKAEYFLIGTLFSVASAFIIAFLLGLCG